MSKNRKIPSAAGPARKKPRPASAKQAPERRREPLPESGHGGEIVGIMGLGAAIFSLASLLSLQLGGGLLMGPFGRVIASFLYGLAGVCSYVLVGALVLVSIRLFRDRRPLFHFKETFGLTLGTASLTTLIHLIGSGYQVAGHSPGGIVGEHAAEVLRAIISTAGTALLSLTGLVITAMVVAPAQTRQLAALMSRGLQFCWAGLVRAGIAMAKFWGEVIRAILPERDRDEYLDAYDEEDEDQYAEFEIERTDPGLYEPPIIEPESILESGTTSAASRLDAPAPRGELSGDTERIDDEKLALRIAQALDAEAELEEELGEQEPSNTSDSDPEMDSDVATSQVQAAVQKAPRKQAAVLIDERGDDPGAQQEQAPLIVESQFRPTDAAAMRAKEQAMDAHRHEFIPLDGGEYKLPPVNLLRYDESQRESFDRTGMLELSAKLTQTLENYGVKGEVVAIRPGPVVTMYEFAPAPGTRINKIVNLGDDLAMVLEALKVRIVAPIPGKAAVGIEVPNRTSETVYLKEIIADDGFQKGRHKLPLALGKNIEGAPQVVDLAKMPHLLVAGTTGSGKSVSVNSMITSLLYCRTPEEVRMIMVDPKMLELSIYEGIPHLLLPVVTDPKKANLALRWAVEEMDRRYDLLATMGVRDLSSYNKKVEKQLAQHQADKLRLAAQEAQRIADADQDEAIEITEERYSASSALEEPPRRLPYIVVIIDEFADLMMCAPKEVETSVARIAQKARAAGIHLILATQRPSVDVITGLIKANFPSRAAFRVASKVDSRTILDQSGAEALLGSGDMLFCDRGASPRRLHGCFVDEDEIGKVVEFLKTQGKPVYNLDIIRPRDEDEEGDGDVSSSPESGDDMYDRAVALVAETQQVSISMIQRRLRVGYNRAARMVEQMEKEGVVSPPDHTNKREVLARPAA